MIIGLLIAGAVVAVALTVTTTRRSTTVTAATPAADDVTSSQVVVPNMGDQLAPLPAGTVIPMTVGQVIAAMKQSGEDASYLDDPNLKVKSGLYTNRNLFDGNGKSISSVAAYVFQGSGPCVPGGAPSAANDTIASTSTTRGLVTCDATIVVDATTGHPLLLNEVGQG
ncbi:MAG TPA: hypothetical protein VIJ47_13795 [Acidimicrobiales bacterium]